MEVKHTTSEKTKTKSKNRWFLGWVALALIPLSILIPWAGEALRNEAIGTEYVCCMPENRDELERQAQQAREQRAASNLIIVGSDILGLAVLAAGPMIFMKLVVMDAEWSVRKKLYAMLAVGMVAGIALTFEGFYTLAYIFGTENYYSYTQPYYGGYYSALFGL